MSLGISKNLVEVLDAYKTRHSADLDSPSGLGVAWHRSAELQDLTAFAAIIQSELEPLAFGQCAIELLVPKLSGVTMALMGPNTLNEWKCRTSLDAGLPILKEQVEEWFDNTLADWTSSFSDARPNCQSPVMLSGSEVGIYSHDLVAAPCRCSGETLAWLLLLSPSERRVLQDNASFISAVSSLMGAQYGRITRVNTRAEGKMYSPE